MKGIIYDTFRDKYMTEDEMKRTILILGSIEFGEAIETEQWGDFAENLATVLFNQDKSYLKG